MEHVNHPSHYNHHPAGIECIEIIRHYTCDIANAIKYLWRAGLKPEMGKADAEKEIEDMKKALWYIEDFRKNCEQTKMARNLNIPKPTSVLHRIKPSDIPSAMDGMVEHITGHCVADIVKCYCDDVRMAMTALLRVGLIVDGEVLVDTIWQEFIAMSIRNIQNRILEIECMLTDKELRDTLNALSGNAIDGEDYVSKPGCNRETEPEKYDPLNMVVVWGRVYSLTNEVRKKKNGALYSPCENCDLWSQCHEWQDMPTPMLEESKCHFLCTHIHNAESNEYYREVGQAKYFPKFGTIEVVDEMKEVQLDLKRMQEEIDNDKDNQ